MLVKDNFRFSKFRHGYQNLEQRNLKHPEIIIYFHMKDQNDCSETAKLAADKDKYSQITIIDMDFTRENLSNSNFVSFCMKDVNKRAYERLNEHMKTVAKFENKLFVYDDVGTKESETIIEELRKFMQKRLHVEKAEDKNKVPLAVICNQQADHNSLLEVVKGSHASDIILFRLCTRLDVVRKATGFEEINIDICDKEKYFITFDIGLKLIDFVRLSFIRNKKNIVQPPKEKSLEDTDKDEQVRDERSPQP